MCVHVCIYVLISQPQNKERHVYNAAKVLGPRYQRASTLACRMKHCKQQALPPRGNRSRSIFAYYVSFVISPRHQSSKQNQQQHKEAHRVSKQRRGRLFW